jgi:hypothetical protein
MSEHDADGRVAALSGVELLELAVARLAAESPVELDGQIAMERLRTIIDCTERLHAARLAAIRDVDRRELWALDGAGSTRGWLRNQLGGESGQLAAARRLEQRPVVEAALAGGQVSNKAAAQAAAVLEKVPAHVDEALLTGVLLDGVGGLLQTCTGGLVPDDAVTPELLAARDEAAAVLQACVADVVATPAARLEPALVLLARRLSPGQLGPALRQLLEAVLPDGSDGLDRDPYYLELRQLLDGDVDLRGHLDAETGHALAAEVERRVALRRAAERAAKAAAGTDDAARGGEAPSVEPPQAADFVEGPIDAAARLAEFDAALSGESRPAAAGQPPLAGCSAGRRRHDALGHLLNDLAGIPLGSGQPAPAALTIVATPEAVEGRLGALPGMLIGSIGGPVPLRTETLQRFGCHSELNVVLLDALGNPVGASGTHRSANPTRTAGPAGAVGTDVRRRGLHQPGDDPASRGPVVAVRADPPARSRAALQARPPQRARRPPDPAPARRTAAQRVRLGRRLGCCLNRPPLPTRPHPPGSALERRLLKIIGTTHGGVQGGRPGPAARHRAPRRRCGSRRPAPERCSPRRSGRRILAGAASRAAGRSLPAPVAAPCAAALR